LAIGWLCLCAAEKLGRCTGLPQTVESGGERQKRTEYQGQSGDCKTEARPECEKLVPMTPSPWDKALFKDTEIHRLHLRSM